MDKKAHIITLNELKQHFQVLKQGKQIFLLLPSVRIWFKSEDSSASSLGSSSVLLVQFESVIMMPARMCLTFCAQTLVHAQTIKRLSHLDTGLPVSCLSQHGGWDRGWVPPASDFTRKAQTSHTTWCLTKISSAGNCSSHVFQIPTHGSLRQFFLCVFRGYGGGGIDFKPQLNKNSFFFFFNAHSHPDLSPYSVKEHYLDPLSSLLVIRLSYLIGSHVKNFQ